MQNWRQEITEILATCRAAFVPSDRQLLRQSARQSGLDLTQMAIRMNDLYRGYVLKIYTEVVRADNKWSKTEKAMGALIIEHFWDRTLSDSELKTAWQGLMSESEKLTWSQLFSPFLRCSDLGALRSDVFTAGMRLANIIAKCDGVLQEPEAAKLRSLEQELHKALSLGKKKTNFQQDEWEILVPISEPPGSTYAPVKQPTQTNEGGASLEESMKKLDSLIGLNGIKKQVEELTHFLRMQQQRKSAGLPVSHHNLHMVFKGNPGTGKTTVARILADIMRGLGVLNKGHLIETDRSGLVAEYAGQTATKTSKRIDEALDGILFIDEAYSLVDSKSDDAYGREALQILLKRMEDDRERLVVILAGYGEPIDKLLKSNPGLTSRIGMDMHFEDYDPKQLLKIFELLCKEHHYQCLQATREAMYKKLVSLHSKRDVHFGNGRVVRNLFEKSIRRMASRIAPITPVTHDLLTQIMPEDLADI